MTQEREASAALTAKVADLQQKLVGASKGIDMYKEVMSATEQQQQQVLAPRQRHGSLGGAGSSPKAQLVGSIYRYKSTAGFVTKKGDTMLKSATLPVARTRYSASN